MATTTKVRTESGAVPDRADGPWSFHGALSAEQATGLASLFEEAWQARTDDRRPTKTESGRVSSDNVLAAKGIKVQPGVRIGPVGKLLVRILEHYPKKGEITITSGYRPEHRSYHGGLLYRGSPAAAIDIGAGGLNPGGSRRMRDVAKWLYGHFAADTVKLLIHTTPYATDPRFLRQEPAQVPGGGPYDKATRQQHRNHVHFATSKALARKILARLNKPRAPAPRSRGTKRLVFLSAGEMGHEAAIRRLQCTLNQSKTHSIREKRRATFTTTASNKENLADSVSAGTCASGLGGLVELATWIRGRSPADHLVRSQKAVLIDHRHRCEDRQTDGRRENCLFTRRRDSGLREARMGVRVRRKARQGP